MNRGKNDEYIPKDKNVTRSRRYLRLVCTIVRRAFSSRGFSKKMLIIDYQFKKCFEY